MIAITVSTNYEDILSFIIPQNYKFFDKWYIITDKRDIKTINVIKSFNCSNIEIVFFDFYSRGKKFNKGGAIKLVQGLLSSLKYDGPVLLMDSDIYLPDTFGDIIAKYKIEPDTLYGTFARYDFYSLQHFKDHVIDLNYPWAKEFQGYFQLYKFDSAKLYNESNNCSECDLEFIQRFKHKVILADMNVSHLGKAGVNWNGRKNHNDFLS